MINRATQDLVHLWPLPNGGFLFDPSKIVRLIAKTLLGEIELYLYAGISDIRAIPEYNQYSNLEANAGACRQLLRAPSLYIDLQAGSCTISTNNLLNKAGTAPRLLGDSEYIVPQPYTGSNRLIDFARVNRAQNSSDYKRLWTEEFTLIKTTNVSAVVSWIEENDPPARGQTVGMLAWQAVWYSDAYFLGYMKFELPPVNGKLLKYFSIHGRDSSGSPGLSYASYWENDMGQTENGLVELSDTWTSHNPLGPFLVISECVADHLQLTSNQVSLVNRDIYFEETTCDFSITIGRLRALANLDPGELGTSWLVVKSDKIRQLVFDDIKDLDHYKSLQQQFEDECDPGPDPMGEPSPFGPTYQELSDMVGDGMKTAYLACPLNTALGQQDYTPDLLPNLPSDIVKQIGNCTLSVQFQYIYSGVGVSGANVVPTLSGYGQSFVLKFRTNELAFALRRAKRSYVGFSSVPLPPDNVVWGARQDDWFHLMASGNAAINELYLPEYLEAVELIDVIVDGTSASTQWHSISEIVSSTAINLNKRSQEVVMLVATMLMRSAEVDKAVSHLFPRLTANES